MSRTWTIRRHCIYFHYAQFEVNEERLRSHKNERLLRDIQTPNESKMKLTLNIKDMHSPFKCQNLVNTYWHKHTDIITYKTAAKYG